MDEQIFDRMHLEDSYFLGMVADGTRLRLRVLFAVLPGHPSYAQLFQVRCIATARAMSDLNLPT